MGPPKEEGDMVLIKHQNELYRDMNHMVGKL